MQSQLLESKLRTAGETSRPQRGSYRGLFIDVLVAALGVSATEGPIATAVLNAPGTGYQAADVLSLVGGDGLATITVDTVDGSGIITGATLTDNGSDYSAANGVAVTGGAGTGATFNTTITANVEAAEPSVKFVLEASIGDSWVTIYDSSVTGTPSTAIGTKRFVIGLNMGNIQNSGFYADVANVPLPALWRLRTIHANADGVTYGVECSSF